eukprot:6173503-Pleurochrysis_carterae.AAC.3
MGVEKVSEEAVRKREGNFMQRPRPLRACFALATSAPCVLTWDGTEGFKGCAAGSQFKRRPSVSAQRAVGWDMWTEIGWSTRQKGKPEVSREVGCRVPAQAPCPPSAIVESAVAVQSLRCEGERSEASGAERGRLKRALSLGSRNETCQDKIELRNLNNELS